MYNIQTNTSIQDIRLHKKISQKKLCNGLCSIAQLSRYESGQRFPKKIMFDTLIERLGESSKYFNYVSDFLDYQQCQYREKLIYYSMSHNNAKVDYYIDKYKSSSDKLDSLDNQFLSMILISKIDSPEEKIKKYTDTIKMTIPEFDISNISNYLLSHTEISLINAIACCYKKNNQLDIALNIFNSLAFYIDRNISSAYEKSRNQTLILANLTNLLLLNKQYIDVLYWSNKGIDICKEINDSYFLPVLYHAKCKALINIGSIDEAKKLAVYTYYLFKVNGQTNLAELILKDLKQSSNISFKIELVNTTI